MNVEKFPERLALYNAGYCDAEIGRRLGITPDAMSRWRKYHNYPTHKHGIGRRDLERKTFYEYLPPEQWPLAERFLSIICAAKRRVEKTGERGTIDLTKIRDVFHQVEAIQ